ncbi:MAG: segregation/condensation protein A [Gemmatimonadota bacterium]
MDLTVSGAAPERTGTFLVEIERFQGPLDLLLHLIRTQDIDVLDIPIARITDQFLKAIQGLAAHDLDGAGEFLEMAATLVRIKAQMLLPRPSDDDDEDPRAELVRRLLEYEQIREVTHRLRVSEAERGRRFGKGYVPVRPKRPAVEAPLETTWDEVYEAALGVELPIPRDRRHRVTARTVSMEEKAVLILDALKGTTRVEFTRLLEGFAERMHGVMTLLAGLELTRRRLLLLRQTRPFADLWIYRREDEEEGDAATGGGDPFGDGLTEAAEASSLSEDPDMPIPEPDEGAQA